MTRGREEARRTEGDSKMTEDTSGRELGSEDGVADGGGRRSGFVYGAGAKCGKVDLPMETGGGKALSPNARRSEGSTPAISKVAHPMRK
jgi:hypothetical protein